VRRLGKLNVSGQRSAEGSRVVTANSGRVQITRADMSLVSSEGGG